MSTLTHAAVAGESDVPSAVTQTQTQEELYEYPDFTPNAMEDSDEEVDPSDPPEDTNSNKAASVAGDFLDRDEEDFRDDVDATGEKVYLFKDGTHDESLSFPSIPQDFVPPPPKNDSQPPFQSVDNPGKWNPYVFTPKFNKKGIYMYHQLPSGATPVPGTGTVREHQGWKFHYSEWNGTQQAGPQQVQAAPQQTPQQTTSSTEANFCRKHVTPSSSLFPEERKGSLDADKLKKHGLTDERMANGDALFFYQLLLPFHKSSQMEFNDNRKNFYNTVLTHTNVYHVLKYEGGYKKIPKTFSLSELLRFDGILYLHAALGSKFSIAKRWDPDDCFYQKDIKQKSGMSFGRWEEIKKNLKLCDNRVEEALDGTDRYNPAHKFDLIYQCLVHNVNEFTQKSCLDLVIDESTWPYYGFGGIFVDYLTDKMCSRGGQTVLLMDSDRLRPRGFLHRRKSYKKTPGFSYKGMSEVHDLISKYVLPEIGEGKLWSSPPHLTVDNYFNGDSILDWMGQRGLGMMGTVARNRLPKGIDGKYLHKERITANKKRQSRCARLLSPITMVKDVPADAAAGTKAYRRVHCSFQSTGPCNLGSVNSIPSSHMYVKRKSRGSGSNRRHWGIEMNESRDTYLNSYGKIDQTDGFISRADVKYRSWKYYHAAVNHAKSLVIATAWDMYKECCEGNLDASWKVKHPLSFNEFQQRLAKQLIRYHAKQGHLPGDTKLYAHIQARKSDRGHGLPGTPPSSSSNKKSKRSRHRMRERQTCYTVPGTERKLDYLSEGSIARAESVGRFCDNLSHFQIHVDSRHSLGPKQCHMCEELTHLRCGICKEPNGKAVALCSETSRPPKRCFSDFHNRHMFGLGRQDFPQVRGQKKSEWTSPTAQEISDNSGYVMSFADGEDDDTEADGNRENSKIADL
jgi:hypothetical protein